MKEIITENGQRHREIERSLLPICSDHKCVCIPIPDYDVKPNYIAQFAEALASPAYKRHLFAYCPLCDDLLLFGCGVEK